MGNTQNNAAIIRKTHSHLWRDQKGAISSVAQCQDSSQGCQGCLFKDTRAAATAALFNTDIACQREKLPHNNNNKWREQAVKGGGARGVLTVTSTTIKATLAQQCCLQLSAHQQCCQAHSCHAPNSTFPPPPLLSSSLFLLFFYSLLLLIFLISLAAQMFIAIAAAAAAAAARCQPHLPTLA